MLNKAILEAQKGLYQKGRAEALQAFNRAQADLYRFDGAIEACNGLLVLLESLEREQKKQGNNGGEQEQPLFSEITNLQEVK